jgi:hypothetical protein
MVFYFLGFKVMESFVIISKEIIYPTKFPLEINCCGFTFVLNGVVTTLTKNSSTTYATLQWALLMKQ